VSKSSSRLTQGAIPTTILKMTGHMFLGILSMVAFSLVDTYFVGMLGTSELAAMTFTFPVIMIINGLSFGLGVGATTVISRAIGQGDRYRVKRLTTDALALGLIVVATLTMIGLATMEPIFAAMGAKSATIPLIIEYMQVWYMGTVFVVIPMIGNSAIRAGGDAKNPAIIMLISVAVNAALDPVLIFGLGPIPALGLAGAALATVLARTAAMLASLWLLHHKYKMLTFTPPPIAEGLASWRAILYVGLPNAATNIVLPLGSAIITRLVSGYGEAAVAGLGVASRIDMFAMTPIMALGSSLGPFVGQNWGAGELTRVRAGVSFAMRASLAWGAFIMIPLSLFGGTLAGWFGDDHEMSQVIVLYLAIVPVGYGMRSMVNLAKVAMNSLNRPIPGSLLTLGHMFLLFVPMAWLASNEFGLAGIFASGVISAVIAGTIAIWQLTRVISEEACEPQASSDNSSDISPGL
jgi:MATE family, multidrug efflux pump